MIRIGFDPGLEAQHDHRALIRENELLRLAYEGMPQKRSGIFNTSKILALIGKEFTTLGASLESRYGDELEDRVMLDMQDSSDACSD